MTSQATSQIVSALGRNITTARLAEGLTQRKVALALDVDIRAVNRWERAGIVPSSKNLAALAQLLKRDPGWFYTDHAKDEAA